MMVCETLGLRLCTSFATFGRSGVGIGRRREKGIAELRVKMRFVFGFFAGCSWTPFYLSTCFCFFRNSEVYTVPYKLVF